MSDIRGFLAKKVATEEGGGAGKLPLNRHLFSLLCTSGPPSTLPLALQTSTSYAEPFLAVADARQVALVSSYRDIFPHKFAEIVKVQLSFLVDVPIDILREESFVETPPMPLPDDSKKNKIRAQVLGSRLGKWLHKTRRRGDEDTEGKRLFVLMNRAVGDVNLI